MITDKVIKDLYKTCSKPAKASELNLEYFMALLGEHHNIHQEDDEVFVEDLEEFNPFRRFLKRSIHGVVEFEKNVAFVFRGHILFFSKVSNDMRVHIRPAKKKSIFARMFGDD